MNRTTKILLTAGAAWMTALLATGCDKQPAAGEGGGQEDLAIRVTTQVGGTMRSSHGTGAPESLKEFDLLVETFVGGVNPWGSDHGYNYNNSKFTYDSGSDEWTPSVAASKMLWYNSTTKVRVAAMAPCREEGTYSIGWDPRVSRLLCSDTESSEYVTFEVQPEQKRDDYGSDLLFYYKNNVTPADLLQGGELPVVFPHMLSNLVITFKLGTEFNQSGVPAEDIISDVVVSGTKRTVRFVKDSDDALSITAIGDASDVKSYNASWNSAADKTGNCTSMYECILAPQTVAADQFKLNFKVDGRGYNWTLPSEYVFTGNYIHNLSLRVGKDAVVLDGVSTTKWDTVDGGTIETD